ncbi:putative ErfK/YbiS/YcfS/YnhG family protein; signal peptide [Bradyrhizobium sp. STM 3843]|uniref:L,D-transpeptidase n=1 Tax=Bradyrhizobium sp. STM 3843 TaxID=551947 RepID=UPI00024031F4|nr:L,D-transpeptidase [Bradyrhizobium sp. STM 3843]CCE08279.1 putative ErfK/YbiS/YcfS/YnhG family protein; signal peptide [Bradyrhizobium sp. STM 3843]
MLCVHSAVRRRFYCAAILSGSIAIGAGSQAAAQGYSYWNPSFYRPERQIFHHQRPKARHHQTQSAVTQKEAVKPQGPLIVAVSINRQQVKVYDSNGLFAEAPVSTGMKGHSTPTGVFSVIQKQKFHRSNIYSGAPMPFMQRITWSGIALHAGVLPGYPASHGCIRMPPSFAVKMYGWTRVGARVFVTPAEVEPSDFTHPLLASLKAPQPSASALPEATTPAAPKADKGAALIPVTVNANLDLRSTIGHDELSGSAGPAAPLRGQTHTADASVAPGSTTISDVPRVQVTPRVDVSENVTPVNAGQSSASGSDPAAGDIPTKPGAGAAAEAGTRPESKPADGEPSKHDDMPTTTTKGPEKPQDVTAVPASGVPASNVDKSADVNSADKPAEPAKASADGPAAPADKDQTRLSESEKAPLAKPELKRNSPVAIFISRKDSKLYVRQNFAAVFKVAVTIAPADRPLGTHVFTATADKADSNVMHWSVVSVPVSARATARNEDGERTARHSHKKGGDAPIEAKAVPLPDSPTEALDRITIPADVQAWLGDALSSGSSLIVSDQGINQGETGEGTEFILSLR